MHKILLVFLVVASSCFGQVDNARKTVEKLCSPEFHGRGYVNGGDSIAAAYLAQQYKEIGCKFYKKKPFQNFDFQVNRFPSYIYFNIKGDQLKPGVDFVVSPDCGNYERLEQPAIELKPSDFLTTTALKDVISKNKGKALVFRTYEWKGDTLKQAKKTINELRSVAAIYEVVDEKFTWSVDQQQAPFPLIQIQKRCAEQPIPYIGYINVHAEVVNHQARNVIAYIPAKKRTKKCFVFSAHYDHLGQMGDSAYFPGGNDNASGTAMLLEMARYFKEHPSNVNVVFMSFCGEEVGLLGSHYYVEHPLFPLKDIQFLFNLDIMGSGEEGVTIVNGSVFQKEFDMLSEINKTQDFVSQVKIRGKAANSDHYFFSEAGVPAFFMYTMGPNKHYHDVGDTYENLSFNEFNDIYQLLIDFEELMTKRK